MKYGVTASKELMEYFKERSTLDEHNSKVLLKLAHKVGSSGASGTFSPLLVILKTSAERLSELHTQMVQKTTELVKNILKYADELHKKHKTVKEEESSTQDAVQQMKESTTAVQKAKDLYQTRLQELEKLRKDNASAKDIEKAETKLKKHQDEYKNLAEKHNPIKQEFERRMTVTCKVSELHFACDGWLIDPNRTNSFLQRFQDIEEAHLKQMKEFIMMYIDIVQNNHDLVGQVSFVPKIHS
jgi:F-BAR domain only protein